MPLYLITARGELWNVVFGAVSPWVFVTVALWNRAGHYIFVLFIAALCNRGPLYFCPVISIVFYLFFLAYNLSGHRLDLYHTSTHGVALVRI